MIEIRIIDKSHENDINIPNEPFPLFGKLLPEYKGGKWSCSVLHFPPEDCGEMRFPDEHYRLDEMADCVFLGAYDGEKCIGLAVLQQAMFKYMYLYDFKVNREYRGRGIGKMLIAGAKRLAAERGFRGVYTIGQDNNLGACLFYLGAGFRIGGLDTEVYRGTKQQGKADIYFYTEC